MQTTADADDGLTLRLLMPQWQGGGEQPGYYLGGRLLAWLAPPSSAAVEEVTIGLGREGHTVEQGIFAREVLLAQAREARRILERRQPDRVVVFGGECSVDFAPVAYLNERYDGDLAVLWLDAHPDTALPQQDDRNVNFHSMVLSALLGLGDAAFVAEVTRPLVPAQLLFTGLRAAVDELDAVQTHFGVTIPNATVDEVAASSDVVLQWMRECGASRVAIHFDLDVLEPAAFSSTIWQAANGLGVETAVRLLADVSQEFDVVGLGITEYVPRDALRLAGMLRRLPLVGSA